MIINQTQISGVLVLKPKVYQDERGYFFESYNKNTLKEAGIHNDFVQDNHACSTKGVLRGLHFQKKYPQGKLVRVLNGAVLDVIVDIRKGSPTFGHWISLLLSAEDKELIWIPEGLAHGYIVFSETADFFYKVTEFYHPEDESGIRWDDPELAINWQITDPIVSKKDKNLPFLKDISVDLPVFKADAL